MDRLGGGFQLLAIDGTAPEVEGVEVVSLTTEDAPELAARYLGEASGAIYLLRPDQHVAARWRHATAANVRAALSKAMGG